MRCISYGGGVQSTALLVLAVEGKLDEVLGGPVDAALFANVGDDSEHPASLRFVREVAQPWAAEHGLRVEELCRVRRDNSVETLWDQLVRSESRSIGIPVRMANGAPGNRSCTYQFKIAVVGRWLRERGASADCPATVAIGISTDEFQRASRKRAEVWERPVFPLLELGLSRADCVEVIHGAGLPVPPKSSCFFCPFHRPSRFAEMRRDEPELFEKAQVLEDLLNVRRVKLGKDPVFLTRFNRRLSDAVAEAQTPLWSDGEFNDGQCDEGYCWT